MDDFPTRIRALAATVTPSQGPFSQPRWSASCLKPQDETLAPIGCAFRKMTGGGSLRHVELWLDFREDLKPWPLAG